MPHSNLTEQQLAGLSSRVRQALLHADDRTGTVGAVAPVLTEMCGKRLAVRKEGKRGRGEQVVVLTPTGRDRRRLLLEMRRSFRIGGVSWETLEQATDLYLAGASLDAIARRCRLTEGEVEAALEARGVLVQRR